MLNFYYTNDKFLKPDNDPLFFIHDVARDKPKFHANFSKFNSVNIEIDQPLLINPPAAPQIQPPNFYARNIKPIIDILSSAFFYIVESVHTLFRAIFCCCAAQIVEEKQPDIKKPLPQPLLPALKPIVISPLDIPKKNPPKQLNQHFKTAPKTFSPAVQKVDIVPKPDFLAKKQKIAQELQKDLLAETNEWWKDQYTLDQMRASCQACVGAQESAYILRRPTTDGLEKYVLHYQKEGKKIRLVLAITAEGNVKTENPDKFYPSFQALKEELHLTKAITLNELKKFETIRALKAYKLDWSRHFTNFAELKEVAKVTVERKPNHFFIRQYESESQACLIIYQQGRTFIETTCFVQPDGTLKSTDDQRLTFKNLQELQNQLGTPLILADLLSTKEKIARQARVKQEIETELLAPNNAWWKGHYSQTQFDKLCDNCVKQAINSTYILRKSTSDHLQTYILHYKKDNITYNVQLEITPEGTLSIPSQENTYANLGDLKKALGLGIPVNLQTLKTFQNQTTLEQYLLDWKQEFSDVDEFTYITQFALLRNEEPHFYLKKSESQAHVFYISYKKDQQIIQEKLTLQANGTLQIPSQGNRVFQNFKELSQAINLGTPLTIEDIREAKAFLIKHAPAPKEFLQEPQAILNPEEEGEFEEAHGPRTLGMYSYLHGFKAYDSIAKQLTLQGKTYTPVTGGTTSLSQKRLISCGSSPSREAILLDPENSPILNHHFDKLLQQIQAKQDSSFLTEEQIINEVIRYVRQDIFPSCRDRHLEDKVDRFIKDKWGSFPALYYQQDGRQGYIPAIPIDEFIKADIGVCRHHGLVTGYLLDRLTREPAQRPILQGIPQIIRDNIDNGAHLWTTFMSAQGKKWHIDTLWPVKEEFSQPQGIQRLQNRGYGIAAIRNQIARTQGIQKLAIEGSEKKKLCKKALNPLVLNFSNISVIHMHRVLANQPKDYVIRESTSDPHSYVLHYWDGVRFHQNRFTIQQDGAIRLSQQIETYQNLADMIAKLNLKQCLTRADIDSHLQALAAE